MAAKCFSEQGDCLLDLGRLDAAAAAYEERIRRGKQLGDERGVAIANGQLGTVRKDQHDFKAALAAYVEACERFTQLDEPGSVAEILHQTGTVYQEASQPEAAEDAYRKSLAIKVRLEDSGGQASTLNQLGILYDNAFDRPEEGIAFFRQATDKFIEVHDVAHEGVVRNNFAATLRKLRRLDEARQEIHRAIECNAQFGHASSPWTSWSILACIEMDASNPAAAAVAKGKAIASYLAYRRAGGENHNDAGRISLAVTQSLLTSDLAAAASHLQELAARSEVSGPICTFMRALQSIVSGSRNQTLADAADLDYTMAAEVLLLIEILEKHL